jgi:hypothetical protein
MSTLPTPSLRLSNPTSACPHPVRGCRTPHLHAHTQFKADLSHLCMRARSSRQLNFTHTLFKYVHPAHTQFEAVEPHLCMPTLCTRLSNPTSPCPHPVRGCRNPPLLSNPTSACPYPVHGRTPLLHAHTQFKTVEPHLCMPTPSSRLSIPTSPCPNPVQGF